MNHLKTSLYYIKQQHINKILFIQLAVILILSVTFNRGLSLDGAHNLLRMILDNSFYHLELSRVFINSIQQFPALIFIKYFSSSSVSMLIKIFSFGLIYIHALSILGCYLILPKNKKNYIFFPMLAFFAGPVTSLSLPIAASTSVFSYVWLALFTIYYSPFNFLGRCYSVLVLIPLFLSHELMFYMSWFFIFICHLKFKNKSRTDQLIAKFMISFLFIISITSLFFIIFPVESESSNRSEFFKTLFYLKFFFNIENGANWIFPPAIASFFFLILPFLSFKNYKLSYNFSIICLILIIIFGLLSIISPFYNILNILKQTNEETTRVWTSCFALPLSVLMWYLFEHKKIRFNTIFYIAVLFLTSSLFCWRITADYQFYKNQKVISKKLSKCKGIIDIDQFKKTANLNKLVSFHINSYSLLFQNKKNISALVSEDSKTYIKMQNCFYKSKNLCPFNSKKKIHHCYYNKTFNNMCQYFNLLKLNQSRFFNLDTLIQFIKNKPSYCLN